MQLSTFAPPPPTQAPPSVYYTRTAPLSHSVIQFSMFILYLLLLLKLYSQPANFFSFEKQITFIFYIYLDLVFFCFLHNVFFFHESINIYIYNTISAQNNRQTWYTSGMCCVCVYQSVPCRLVCRLISI